MLNLNEYKAATKAAMVENKLAMDNDQFIIDCRNTAQEAIKSATKSDGSLNWSKLPKLIGQNTKMKKDALPTMDSDLEIWGLSLAPANVSGFNTCSQFSAACANVCLMFTGLGSKYIVAADGNHKVAIARIIRTILWFKFRDQFKARLLKEITNKSKLLKSKNIAMAFRPNVFSEIKFEKLFPELFELCGKLSINVYDYVKDIKRITENKISNYNMTFSLSENNALFIPTALAHGCNIAVVTDIPLNKNKDRTYKFNPPKTITIGGITLSTIDGDKHDARFLDTIDNAFVVLRGKGQIIRKDTTGFMHKLGISA